MHLGALSKGTPLFDHAGKMAENSSEAVTSYFSVHDSIASKAKMYTSKYAQFVIDYAIEWEKVVVARVNAGLKKANDLRVEADHYQGKVESLRQSANQTMAKGKQVDNKTAEKLSRNEEKLGNIKKSHQKFTYDLCLLMEEVTVRSWRDLHPLLVKVAQFDTTLCNDQAKTMAGLDKVVTELKKLAVTHGIKPQARLKDLDSLEPELLSTRSPDSNIPAIEAGVGGLSLEAGRASPIGSDGGFPSSNERFPPGSVAPQGLGGFPVPVQNSDSDTRSVGNSVKSGSHLGTPSTLDMVAINKSAAPPPTVDQLTAAFGPTTNGSSNPSYNGMGSAPNSGALPPLGPNAGLGVRGRNQSLESFDSHRSGASAPPPAAPPPPPPGTSFAPAPSPYGGGAPNPFGAAPAPNPFGAAPAPNPYGAAPAPNPFGAPPSTYGAPNPFGNGPAPTSPYGAPSTPNSLGGSGPSPMYGAPPPVSSYGQPQTNFAQQPSYGQQPPNYGQQPSYTRQPSYGSTNTNPFDD